MERNSTWNLVMWRNVLQVGWAAFRRRSHPFLCSTSWSTKSRSWKWYGLLNWDVQMKLASTVICRNRGDRKAFCLTLKRCQKSVEKISCRRRSNKQSYIVFEGYRNPVFKNKAETKPVYAPRGTYTCILTKNVSAIICAQLLQLALPVWHLCTATSC